MGGNFREKLEEGPRIQFRGFNFRGAISIRSPYARNVNFELGTRGESFAVDKKRWNASQCHVLDKRLSLASQTQPAPARIAFRVIKLSALAGILKAVRAAVWLARPRERLPRLHLGG